MASSTWSGFFKRRHRAPDQGSADADPGEGRNGARAVEVAFESLDYEDGQPFIALVFLRGGVRVDPSGRVFTFELTPGTPKLEADTLASLLGRGVTHLVETQADAEEPGAGSPEPGA